MSHGPKVLLLDIETTPLLIDAWDTGKQYVSHDQILEDRSVLSWAAKWYGEKNIMYMDTRSKRNKRHDKAIIKGAWKLLDEADVIITQNGKRFDEKVLNSRFLKYEMGEPGTFQHIDTLKIMKSRFKLPSYSLGYITKFLGIEEKYTQRPAGYNGRELWRKCWS